MEDPKYLIREKLFQTLKTRFLNIEEDACGDMRWEIELEFDEDTKELLGINYSTDGEDRFEFPELFSDITELYGRIPDLYEISKDLLKLGEILIEGDIYAYPNGGELENDSDLECTDFLTIGFLDSKDMFKVFADVLNS